MKYLFILLIFVLFLSLTFSTPVIKTDVLEQLIDFHYEGLNNLQVECLEKTKNFSESVLQQKASNETSSTEIREFFNYVQDFLVDYPHIKRYEIQQIFMPILIFLLKMEKDYVIYNQLYKQCFGNIFKEYEKNYENFINVNFTKKYEDLLQELKIRHQIQELHELFNKFKNWSWDECYPLNYDQNIFRTQYLYKNLSQKYFRINIKKYVALEQLNVYNHYKKILKSEKLLQLTSVTRNNLTNDLNDFVYKFETSNNIENFALLYNKNNSLQNKYLNNTDIPTEDAKIFEDMMADLKPINGINKYESLKWAFYAGLSVKYGLTIWSHPEYLTEEINNLLKIRYNLHLS